MAYFDLILPFFIRVAKPRYYRQCRYRRAHSEIGHYLTVITKLKRGYRIKNAESDSKYLSPNVALGNEDKRGHAYKRGNKVENATVMILEKKKGQLRIKVLNAEGNVLLDIVE